LEYLGDHDAFDLAFANIKYGQYVVSFFRRQRNMACERTGNWTGNWQVINLITRLDKLIRRIVSWYHNLRAVRDLLEELDEKENGAWSYLYLM
jgi:hypothetical protein